jgi:hypothetical protein
MAEKSSHPKDKISLHEIKQLPPQFLLGLINRAKKHLKDDEVMQRVFEDYDVDIEELDLIPITFADLDVSAKTDHGVVYLNYKLLCDGDFLKDYSYLIHEITHILQQTTGTKPTQGANEGEYLKNPAEQEGFQNQIEYIAKEEGPEEAEEYVENLLDHHDVKSKTKKDELEAVLLENV